MRHANLPFHLYVNVSNLALGPGMQPGSTPGVWWGVHCRPGQALMCHVMLASGAQWAGIPIHHVSAGDKFDRHHLELMPWSAMGEHVEAFHAQYIEGMQVGIRKPFDDAGRHTGIVIDWADGFSRYPQEHKPLNLVEIVDQGQFALLPNNFIEFEDRHLVREHLRDDLRRYRRNEQVYWGH